MYPYRVTNNELSNEPTLHDHLNLFILNIDFENKNTVQKKNCKW